MKLYKVLKNKTIVHEGRRYDLKKDSLIEESVITRIYKENFVCVGEKIFIEAPFSVPKVIISEPEAITSESELEVVANEINNNDERSEIGEQKQSRNSKTKKSD
jgi:hypothetical protein